MHLIAIDMHRLQRTGNLLDALFLTREDNDALKVALLEDVVDNLEFLRVVAHIGALTNLLGWFRHGNLYLYGIVEQIDGQLADFRRHRSREHDTLTMGRQLLDDTHDILDKAHIEHTVGLIEYEERTAREVEIAHLQMAEQSAWGSDEYIGTKAHAAQLLFVAACIVATIDGHRRYAIEVIAKALHGLVDLLGEFTSR